MPGTTTNLLLPYPLGTDPIDTAGDIQRLAEALDEIGRRRAVVRQSTGVTAASGVTHTTAWQTTPIDTDGMAANANDSIIPEEGVWVIDYRVSFQSPPAAITIPFINVAGIQYPQFGATDQTRIFQLTLGLAPGTAVSCQIYNGGTQLIYAAEMGIQRLAS